IQDEAGGIAQALSLCEDFAENTEHIIVILGDNVFIGEVNKFKLSKEEAGILLNEVNNPHRFGCAEFDQENNLINIIEKPKNPPSNYAVTGLYIYPKSVFDVIKTMKPSARGELEITDVNNYYLKKGVLKYLIFEGEWTDAGTFESMHKANKIMFDNEKRRNI
ncbi:spore coat protein, partial [Candidatus Woesearchaeota archaeon]|nr:spore coat protein [Candidatus Woesearchaeota archaeon]